MENEEKVTVITNDELMKNIEDIKVEDKIVQDPIVESSKNDSNEKKEEVDNTPDWIKELRASKSSNLSNPFENVNNATEPSEEDLSTKKEKKKKKSKKKDEDSSDFAAEPQYFSENEEIEDSKINEVKKANYEGIAGFILSIAGYSFCTLLSEIIILIALLVPSDSVNEDVFKWIDLSIYVAMAIITVVLCSVGIHKSKKRGGLGISIAGLILSLIIVFVSVMRVLSALS